MKSVYKLISLFTLFSIVSCSGGTLELKDKAVTHETKFGGIYIDETIEDFNKLGFKFGDSVDVTFSNGYKQLDLPYYNGYYVDNLKPLLVGYPGYPFIKTCINNGNDMWELGNLKEGDTATIKLNKKGKYLDIQEAMDIHYTDEQGDIPDEVFGNFRVVNLANLKNNILYRGASPVDNQHKRAPVVDRLLGTKVNTIINLSDNDQEITEHIAKPDFNSPNFHRIYENGNVIALSMNMNFQSSLSGQEKEEVTGLFTEFKNADFTAKLIRGLRFMIAHEGPYMVHCVEGKDRTGFVMMVLETLAGATYNQIIDDYMITYDNYYGINKTKDLNKYNVIKGKNIDVMLSTLIGDSSVDITTANYANECEEYLRAGGLSASEITQLKARLLK